MVSLQRSPMLQNGGGQAALRAGPDRRSWNHRANADAEQQTGGYRTQQPPITPRLKASAAYYAAENENECECKTNPHAATTVFSRGTERVAKRIAVKWPVSVR